jgi:hypothetical protein
MSASIARVWGLLLVLRHPRRFLAFVGSVIGFLLYVWYAAVRAAPEVKRRKAALRAERARSWNA